MDEELEDQKGLNIKKKRDHIQLKCELERYCDKLIIIGFNSQNYDIPLIKRFLPSALSRLDSLPELVIKKMVLWL